MCSISQERAGKHGRLDIDEERINELEESAPEITQSAEMEKEEKQGYGD